MRVQPGASFRSAPPFAPGGTSVYACVNVYVKAVHVYVYVCVYMYICMYVFSLSSGTPFLRGDKFVRA